MAWGGQEEQEAEIAAGNPNAKNWHDEALKVVEETMRNYWKQAQEELESHLITTAEQSVSSTIPAGADTTMESAFDRHRHNLATAQAACKDSDSLGWNAQLQRYLSVIIENVLKDMNVIAWWAVSDLIIYA